MKQKTTKSKKKTHAKNAKKQINILWIFVKLFENDIYMYRYKERKTN